MAIVDNIDQQVIQALKAGDKDKAVLLRGLKSDIKYKRIDKGKDLTEQEIIEVLASAAKKRRESIEQYSKGGRDDLVKKERAELDFILSYLPDQLSEDKLREMIAEAIKESGAESTDQIGLVMKVIMPRIKGKADGKIVNRIAAEILAK